MKITRCNQLVFYCIVPNCVWACSVASSCAPRHKRFLSDWGRRPSRLSTKYYRCCQSSYFLLTGWKESLNEGTSAMRQWFQDMIFQWSRRLSQNSIGVTCRRSWAMQPASGSERGAPAVKLQMAMTRTPLAGKQILSIYNISIWFLLISADSDSYSILFHDHCLSIVGTKFKMPQTRRSWTGSSIVCWKHEPASTRETARKEGSNSSKMFKMGFVWFRCFSMFLLLLDCFKMLQA